MTSGVWGEIARIRTPLVQPRRRTVQISDKLKAIAAAIGTFGTAVAVAAEDSTLTLTEGGAILAAAVAVGAAVWAVRNKTA